MYKQLTRGWMKHFDFMAIDVLVMQVCFVLAYWLTDHFGNPYAAEAARYQGTVILMAQLAVTFFTGSYHGILKRGRMDELLVVLKYALEVLAVAVAYLFVVHQSYIASRLLVGFTFVFFVLLDWPARLLNKRRVIGNDFVSRKSLVLFTSRALAPQAVARLCDPAEFHEHVLSGVVLLGEDTESTAASDGASPAASASDGIEVPGGDALAAPAAVAASRGAPSAASVLPGAASLADAPDAAGASDGVSPAASASDGIEVPGGMVPLIAYGPEAMTRLARGWVDEVFVLQPGDMALPAGLMDDLAAMGLTVSFSSAAMGGDRWSFTEVGAIGGYRVLTSGAKLATAGQLMVKRGMDVVGGLVGCLITGVLFLFVAPAIYAKSPGPIFFKQKRVGLNGRVFDMYKFRSMYLDAEERKAELMARNKVGDGMMFKMDDDPRIIGSERKGADGRPRGVGNFIRNTSIDEFPQFVNVLKGDMSLVGTRPPTLEEWERYDLAHRARMSIKPGITGMWQVSGRSEITDFEEVVRLDRDYIERWSVWLDVKLLAKTVAVVLTRKGAE